MYDGRAALAEMRRVLTPGGRLLVVNSQFDNRGKTPDLPFTVSAVRRP